MMACVSGASEKGIVCVVLGADARRGAGVRAAVVRPVRPLGAAAASLGGEAAVRGALLRGDPRREERTGGEGYVPPSSAANSDAVWPRGASHRL